MADARVKAIIEAEDHTKAAFESAGKNVESAGVKLDELNKGFTKIALAGTAVFAAISVAVYKSIQASNEAIQVQTQLGAVLRSTGQAAGVTAAAAIDLSKALQKQSTLGDEAILSAENMLLTFTKIKGETFPEATKATLDMAYAMNGGLTPSAEQLRGTAIQLGKALQDPTIGLTALRRVGVNFSDAQQDVIKNLVETGHQAEAQKLILAELAKEFGGSAAAAATTFAGKMLILKEQMNDAQEAVGLAFTGALQKLFVVLEPVITKIITWVSENPKLVAAIVTVTGALAGMLAVTATLAVAITVVTANMAALATAAGVLFGTVPAIIIAAAGSFIFIKAQIVLVSDALKTLWAIVQPLLPYIVGLGAAVGLLALGFNGLLFPVGLVIVALVALAALANVLIGNWGNFKTSMATVWIAVSAGASAMANSVAGFFNWLWQKAIGSVTGLINGVNEKFGGMFKTVGDGFNSFATGISKMWEWIKGKFHDAINVIIDFFEPLINVIKKVAGWLGQSFDWVKEKVSDVGKGIAETAGNFFDFASAGADSLGAVIPPLNELGAGAGKASEATKKAMDDMVESYKKVGEEITNTKNKILDLQKQQEDLLTQGSQQNIEYGQNVAKAYVDQQKKVEDLQKDVQKQTLENLKETNLSNNGENQNKLGALQTQLKKEQAALEKYKTIQIAYAQQVSDAKANADKTEFERTIQSYQSKYVVEQNALNGKLEGIKLELTKQTEKYAALAEFEAKFSTTVIEEAEKRQKGVVGTLDTLIKKYDQLYASAQRAFSVSIGGAIAIGPTAKRAAGGPVSTSTAYLVGENGPELFVPGMSGNIISNGGLAGGGTSINITVTGNSFMGREGVANQIFNELMRTLKRTVKLN